MRILSLLLLLACTSEKSPVGAYSWVSDNGLYTVGFETEPDPLVAGDAVLLVDAPGVTSLNVVAGMTGMSHGTSDDAVVTGADGVFEVGLVFSMAGTWELEFALDGEPGADTASGSVEVQ